MMNERQSELGERGSLRLAAHPVLGTMRNTASVPVTIDGRELSGIDGEPLAALLLAHGVRTLHSTPGSDAPRGLFCGVGRCSDCLMTVDGELNVRACLTPVRAGMRVETQRGLGVWQERP
jgi:predicted molibdopterin-dependent oxidoreductase YjgC